SRLLLITFFVISYSACIAQKPVIRNVDKVKGANGEVITVQGTFNSDATNLSASIGAMKAEISFGSDQLLELLVPPGTTYDNIMVNDISNGLSDYSNEPFLLSFGGNHGITDANLEGQRDFDSESGLYDLCMCDFDDDGKTDIATANNNANSFSLFANT